MNSAVVMAIDENYLKPTAATLRSIGHTDPGQRVIVMGYKLDGKQRLWLKNVDKRVDVEVRDLSDLGIDLSHLPGRWLSQAAYARLFIGDICGDLDRALYVDSDVIFRKSAKPLLSTDFDFKGAPAAAAQDLVIIDFQTRQGLKVSRPNLADFYEDPNLRKLIYRNTGTVNVNIPVWNQMGVREQCLDLLARDDQDHPRIFFLDQDALNLVLQDRWLLLDQVWNLPPAGFWEQPMFQKDFVKGRVRPELWDHWQQNACITHYLGDKPWEDNFPKGPDRDLWMQYFGAEPGLEIPGINTSPTQERT